MKKSGVYKITNKVTGDFYIGSTNNFSRRFIQHRFNGSEKGARKHKMYNDMRKYGIDSFEFEILEETNEYRVREKYYIDTLNPTYNIETETINTMDLKEVKEKHHTSLNSKEYRDKIKDSRDFTKTPEFRNRVSINSKKWWKEHYEEACLMTSIAQSSPEYRQRRHEMAMAYKEQNMLHQPNRKEVIMLDKDGNELMEFPSVANAASYLQQHGYPKANSSGVGKGVQGGFRYGHYWKTKKS